MRQVLGLLLLCTVVYAAAPLVPDAVPPLNEGPAEGPAIVSAATGEALSSLADTTVRVAFVRVQFLEDFTDSTTGDGRFDLSPSEPHDREYFEGLAADMADYFDAVSGGALSIEWEVFPQGPEDSYTLPHQMGYYGRDEDWMRWTVQLYYDGVTAADADVDYSQFDAVVLAHAGAGQEADVFYNSPKDISSIFVRLYDMQYYLPGAGSGFGGIPTDDGVLVANGSIIPEQESQDGYGFGVLGTLCHEFGHQMGLPDLYNTYTGTVGIGGWGLMGYGQWMDSGYWPSAPCAWSRVDLGWTPVREIGSVEEATLSHAYTDTVLKVPLSGSEYLLLENRQRDPDGDGMNDEGERDWGLPGSGILVWHIDQGLITRTRASNIVNADDAHRGVDLEEADGIQDFDYSPPSIYGVEGSEYDPWYRGGYAWLFGPQTEPASVTSWGGNTGITVDVLDPSGNDMRVSVSRSWIEDGWPLAIDPLSQQPMIWDTPQGLRVVLTESAGVSRAFRTDASDPVPVGLNAHADLRAGDPGIGEEVLLLAREDGEVQLRRWDGSQPDGWPVQLGAEPLQALLSERLGMVAVSTSDWRVHLLDVSGDYLDGWPRDFSAPVAGIAVWPEEPYGMAVATAEGRVRLLGLDGQPADGWPVRPGLEIESPPYCADIDRSGSTDLVVVSGGEACAYAADGSPLPGFPAGLPGAVQGPPWPADIDGDGRLETVVDVEGGAAAVTASGSTLSDWPMCLQRDSVEYGYAPANKGVGGSGLALFSVGDGRIMAPEADGSQDWPFPLSTGDGPLGSPILWDLDGDGAWEVLAADASGFVCCWETDISPQGWHTGRDRGGERCWWPDRLPEASAYSGGLAEGSFYVYPNPVHQGSGTIRFQPGSDSDYTIRVFSVAGQLVDRFRGSAPGGLPWEVEWDAEDLAPGLYFVSLELSYDGTTETELFEAAVVN
mgnify:FL=1